MTGTDGAANFGDTVLAFDGLSQSGGFLNSFGNHDGPITEVADGFDRLGLAQVADLIRAGLATLPAETIGADRRTVVDGLPSVAADRLEQLGAAYLELAPQDLSDRIATYWAARPDEAPKDTIPSDVPDENGALLEEYVETLRRSAGAGLKRVATANALHNRNHQLYKRLRETQAGRNGISALMADPERNVRLAAATHSLAWAPEKAVATLEAIEAGPGLDAVTAKYTLRSYRAGRLNLDW